VVVVGAGLLGLATAHSLARRGHEVIVLETGEVGHERAGSKGSARIFRYGYDDPLYVRMAQRAAPLWQQLEEDSCTVLLQQTGQLSYGRDLPSLVEAMESCGAPCRLLPSEEVASCWPALRRGPAVLEPDSGVLFADRCLRALLQGRRFELRENADATAVKDDEDGVTVHVNGGALRARSVIVCGGGRTGSLTRLPRMVPQRSTLEQVVYLQAGESTSGGGAVAFPIVICRSKLLFYSLPVPTNSLLKAGLHGSGPEVDPATATMEEDPDLVGEVLSAAGDLMPGARLEVAATERCLYDSSPDDDFVLDRVGNVIVGCGTSGHGFKFGPYLGEALADLALGLPIENELARFQLR
jgi:sarcosine oxidase